MTELSFLALGGSGEIGANVNIYGCGGKYIMVDCGLTFADPTYPGVDLILPDLEWIQDRRENLLGILITHGHEDHIGALPYLIEDLGAPVYATPFTAGLIAHKLAEAGLSEAADLVVVPESGELRMGPFVVRYLPLAHSIAEGSALLISTPLGRVLHTGDWKLDESPLVGVPSTAEELERIGDEGVLALVCDSTNVFNEEPSGSEADVRENLLAEVAAIPSRVLVTTFASNAARLQTLGEVARACGRQLCVAGRSLDRMLEVGRSVGYFREFPTTIDFASAMRLPRNEVMIVATGGQGEPRAALARIAEGNHPLHLEEGDVVLFSTRQIPGNELAIGRIQNLLAQRGIVMVTDRQAAIHVSGHPGRPELAEMYRWIRPKVLVPVHGEARHLAEHVRFGLARGIPRAVAQGNGERVRLAPGEPTVVEQVRTGKLVVDGDVVLPADGATMVERRKLAQSGYVAVALALSAKRRLVGEPEVRLTGIPIEDERDLAVAEAVNAVKKVVTDRQGRDPGELREAIRLAVRRVITRWTGKKPQVDVLLIEP